jgi:hypothetical protein
MTIYDFSRVPASLMTPDPEGTIFSNAGILHNMGLVNTNEVFRSIGFNADPAIIGEAAIEGAQAAEDAGYLPAGSTAIITEGVQNFLKTKSISEGIAVWQELYTTYGEETTSNPYYNTALASVLNIALYSGNFWKHAVIRWIPQDNEQYRTATETKLTINDFWKKLLADFYGACTGGAIGTAIGATTGVGAPIGTTIGGVIGAVAASFG